MPRGWQEEQGEVLRTEERRNRDGAYTTVPYHKSKGELRRRWCLCELCPPASVGLS